MNHAINDPLGKERIRHCLLSQAGSWIKGCRLWASLCMGMKWKTCWGADPQPQSFWFSLSRMGPKNYLSTGSPDDASMPGQFSENHWYSEQGGLWVKILALYPVSDFLSKGSFKKKKRKKKMEEGKKEKWGKNTITALLPLKSLLI